MAAAQLLLSALSKPALGPDAVLDAGFTDPLLLCEPPLTSEPPMADAAPLTSEPPMADAAPLTSEPTAHGTASGVEPLGV
ncbi:hypothetical protein [Streptomyces sp. H27-C3]|uniref:hypothetical protein n=1 Tax=Streptomyces sp. H27-C3 TaxID=3046305 RepID=UPI0024B99E57|nr:hypothetical protein [Streptomyces sp. H27-C3]MDJ0463611.1 hypothetical protein [Streptomyces sp. H27-C3]